MPPLYLHWVCWEIWIWVGFEIWAASSHLATESPAWEDASPKELGFFKFLYHGHEDISWTLTRLRMAHGPLKFLKGLMSFQSQVKHFGGEGSAPRLPSLHGGERKHRRPMERTSHLPTNISSNEDLIPVGWEFWVRQAEHPWPLSIFFPKEVSKERLYSIESYW